MISHDFYEQSQFYISGSFLYLETKMICLTYGTNHNDKNFLCSPHLQLCFTPSFFMYHQWFSFAFDNGDMLLPNIILSLNFHYQFYWKLIFKKNSTLLLLLGELESNGLKLVRCLYGWGCTKDPHFKQYLQRLTLMRLSQMGDKNNLKKII